MTKHIISRRGLMRTAAALAVLAPLRPAFAQDYPTDKIQMLLPFGAGGGQDEFARRFLPTMDPAISGQIYIDNRPGGNGILASEMLTKSDPDGYTLIQQTSSFTTNPFLNKALPFDTLTDFAPISLVARTPHVLVVRKDFPANTIAEFIEQAKAQPGVLMYGSGGIGSTNHIAALLLEKVAGIEMEHIVYKSSTEYNNDLLGGRLDAVFAGSGQGASLANAGNVKALGVTGDARSKLLPDVPTFAEAGFPDVMAYSWTGYLAPKDTPRAIIDQLSAAMQTAAHDPEVQGAFPAHELLGTTPEEFATFLAEDQTRMGELLQGMQTQ